MASDNVNEQEIQFKKRARRRLVGAVALVLLMITVLPMLLDDRASKAPQQEIAISIPSQDSEFSSKIVPVKPEATAKVESSDSAVPDDQPVTEPDVGGEIAPLSPPVESAKEAIAPAKPAPAKPAAAPVKTAPATPVAKPAEPTKPAETKAVESKPAVAETAKKDTPEKAAGFLVQVGVFSDPDNVKQLQQKLSGLGIKSNTEKLDTPKGPKIRLRSQVYSTRPQAEQALDKIKGAGLTGMVVTSK